MEIVDLILKIIPILGIVPFFKVIWEYVRDLKWKKSEFLAKEIKEFQNDENVRIVFQLLDWNKRKIKIKSGEFTIGDYDLVFINIVTVFMLSYGRKSEHITRIYLSHLRVFCIDNIFIERLWRSLKYECVYLHAWETGSQARVGIGRWITFYNHRLPHTAHGGQPPAVVYFNSIETDQQVQAVA